MHDYQKQFIELALEAGALKFGDFTLKSGRKSPYFFNAGCFYTGKQLQTLGSIFAKTIQHHRLKFDGLFGPAYKGISLASCTAIALNSLYQKDVPTTFDRKEAKTHGEGGELIGAPLQGNILIIDDVITKGTAKKEAIQRIQKYGANIAGILIALDRQEKGEHHISTTQELEQSTGVKVTSIVQLQNLIDYLNEQPNAQTALHAIKSYQATYGVNNTATV